MVWQTFESIRSKHLVLTREIGLVTELEHEQSREYMYGAYLELSRNWSAEIAEISKAIGPRAVRLWMIRSWRSLVPVSEQPTGTLHPAQPQAGYIRNICVLHAFGPFFRLRYFLAAEA
uniref:Uncharacterized protein n=1 Tax=Coccidioides posadasii RMSCC 3488 TaxID=454284 RepID=A0A0J6IKP6_COCPO|nr:hypothetical protein CPAG_08831 [Coccidioides posadasii RMSCC 3488]